MKRFKLLGTGLALVLGLIFAGQARSQTKIAIVNVGEVFQKYNKAKTYKEELDKIVQPRKAEAEKLKNEMIAWKKALDANTIKKEDRPAYEKAILEHKRKLEDMERTIAPQVAKIQEGQIVTLYKDLQAAVEMVAKANAVSLVLAYGDVTEDRFNIFNINRLMNGMDLGSTTPLYFDPSVNITGQVVETLNRHYATTGGPAAGGAPPTGPVTPVSGPGR